MILTIPIFNIYIIVLLVTEPMIEASPAGDVYKFTDETATITCSVESTYGPSFEVKGNDDASFTIG